MIPYALVVRRKPGTGLRDAGCGPREDAGRRVGVDVVALGIGRSVGNAWRWSAGGNRRSFAFSDTWQLVINTGTTIVTFLMVFLIQATQNRDSEAIHLKLDELIRAVGKARTGLVGLENMPEEELKELQNEFAALQAKYAARVHERAQQSAAKNGRAEA